MPAFEGSVLFHTKMTKLNPVVRCLVLCSRRSEELKWQYEEQGGLSQQQVHLILCTAHPDLFASVMHFDSYLNLM